MSSTFPPVKRDDDRSKRRRRMVGMTIEHFGLCAHLKGELWTLPCCHFAQVVEMASCRFGSGCWRPLCPYGHSGPSRAARCAGVWGTMAALNQGEGDCLWAFPGRSGDGAAGSARTRGQRKGKTRVVADGVEGVSVEAETLVPRERVRQLTAEQIGRAPQFWISCRWSSPSSCPCHRC